MTADQGQRLAVPAVRHRRSRLVQIVAIALPILIGAILVEITFESWIQELLGDRVQTNQGPVGWLPDWPKDVKNGLILTLAAASLLKVALERRWREFGTRADLAIAILGVIMVLAGLLGTSSPSLIGAALYVYFRGAVVFYAWRAWNPSWSQTKPLLWLGGALVGLNVLAAIVQMFLGYPIVVAMGWVDTTWVDIHRAQGFTDHPNHLGHVVGIALLGMFAFMMAKPKVSRRTWLAFGALALAMSASQSRESFLAVLGCALLIWYLRRAGGRAMALGCSLVVVLFAAHLAVRPENVQELMRRLVGTWAAFDLPAGTEDCDPPTPECRERDIPSREIRVLYAQQGATLLAHRPLLGYGVGQFGGIVAYEHDPQWYTDTRFGPNGFNTYGFSDITVDSFWLHLAVETGLLGLIAYFVWLWYITLPLLRRTPRWTGRTTRGPTKSAPLPTEDQQPHPAVYWGIATVVFSVLVAFLSPSLEDPLMPMVMFTVIGIAWVMARRPTQSSGAPRHASPDDEATTG
jgi:hypothetical protein